MIIFAMSKFRILVNKCSKNIAIQLVSRSVLKLLVEATKLSHIRSVNEMTGKDACTFSEDSQVNHHGLFMDIHP